MFQLNCILYLDVLSSSIVHKSCPSSNLSTYDILFFLILFTFCRQFILKMWPVQFAYFLSYVLIKFFIYSAKHFICYPFLQNPSFAAPPVSKVHRYFFSCFLIVHVSYIMQYNAPYKTFSILFTSSIISHEFFFN